MQVQIHSKQLSHGLGQERSGPGADSFDLVAQLTLVEVLDRSH